MLHVKKLRERILRALLAVLCTSASSLGKGFELEVGARPKGFLLLWDLRTMEPGRQNWLLLGVNVLLVTKTSNYLMLVPAGEKTLATTGQLFSASPPKSCPLSLASESRSDLIQEEAGVGCA